MMEYHRTKDQFAGAAFLSKEILATFRHMYDWSRNYSKTWMIDSPAELLTT
jgi:hypothetical protein